jgi:hypothetical protein
MGNGLRLELVQSTARSFCAEERQACWRARRRASGSPSHNRHRAGHYRRRHPSPVSPVRNRESSRRRRTESLDRAPSIDRTGLRRASAAGCTILFASVPITRCVRPPSSTKPACGSSTSAEWCGRTAAWLLMCSTRKGDVEGLLHGRTARDRHGCPRFRSADH